MTPIRLTFSKKCTRWRRFLLPHGAVEGDGGWGCGNEVLWGGRSVGFGGTVHGGVMHGGRRMVQGGGSEVVVVIMVVRWALAWWVVHDGENKGLVRMALTQGSNVWKVESDTKWFHGLELRLKTWLICNFLCLWQIHLNMVEWFLHAHCIQNKGFSFLSLVSTKTQVDLNWTWIFVIRNRHSEVVEDGSDLWVFGMEAWWCSGSWSCITVVVRV